MRTIGTWAVLIAFVAMVLLSGLHRHAAVDSVVANCSDCTHHTYHSGHLTDGADQGHHCLLCQFLHLFYSLSAAALPGALVFAMRTDHPHRNNRCGSTVVCTRPSRAPPLPVR